METRTAPESDVGILRAWLLNYCTRLTGCRVEAEDLAQETLLKASPVVFGRVQHPNVKAYLFRIARNQWLDQRKRRAVEQRYLTVLAAPSDHQTEHIDPLDVEYSIQILRRHLTPLQTTVFLLREVLAYSTHEVGVVLQMSETSVKAALHRARSRLQMAREEADVGEAGDECAQADVVRAYATALRTGDAVALVHLAQLDTVDPVHATVRILTLTASPQLKQQTSAGRMNGGTPRCLAA